jgi:Tfp pilus assembly PilM family ATPase
MAYMIGADLGSHSVKIAVFEGGFGRYSLQGFYSRAVPQGEAPLLPRQLQAMEELVDSLEATGRVEVTVAFPCEEMSSRHITLPFGDRAKVTQILPYQVEDRIPFELDDVKIHHRILEHSEEETKTLVAIVPATGIHSLLKGLQEFDINPQHLCVDADALSNFSSSGYQAIIDLGQNRTLCTLCREGKAIAFRSLPMGVEDLHPKTELEQEQEHEQEQTAVPSATVHFEDDDTEEEEMERLLEQFVQRLRLALIDFEDDHSCEIDEVIACGGGSLRANMRDFLQVELGVEVNLATIGDEDVDFEPSYALAYALGLKTAGNSHGREFDLRDEEYAYRGNLAGIGKFLKIGGLSLVAMGLASIGWFAITYNQLSSDLQLAEGEIIAEVAEMMPELDPGLISSSDMAVSLMLDEADEMQIRMDKLGGVISEKPPTLELMRELSEGMPPSKEARIDVTELTITRSSINIKAETDGFEAATTIENSLKARDRLKRAQKADEKKNRNQGIRFTILIPLGEEEAVEE